VSTTPVISCLAVSTTPAKNLLPVSLTLAINLCHGFSMIAGVADTGEQFITGDNDTGEQLSPVTTTPAIHLLPVTRTRTPLRWGAAKERTKLKGINRRYLRPPKSAAAADGVIGTAMKSCIQKHPTHLDQKPLRPPKGAFARFHGCSNYNIGGRGRLRRPWPTSAAGDNFAARADLCHQRESDTRFSASSFFHKSVSPGPLSIPIGPFRIFSKIRGDIRE
jgi:hypothetical protein